jgi:hypothetical protein
MGCGYRITLNSSPRGSVHKGPLELTPRSGKVWRNSHETQPNKISEASPPNKAVLVTAARVRFGLTLKGLVRAAARDGQR